MTRLVIVLSTATVVAALVVGWRFAIFVLPFGVTGEAARLAGLLRIGPGQTVADVGAGDGAMAVEMARRVGPDGLVYATEIATNRLQAIRERVSDTESPNVRVVEGAPDATRLPDGCCDAVYLRTVFHHISGRTAYAGALRQALRPGGRLAVIDFAPGALWFHGHDHGVPPDEVERACLEAGFVLVHQADDWGGGLYVRVFERTPDR